MAVGVVNSYQADVPSVSCEICSEICHESKITHVTVRRWGLNSGVGLKRSEQKNFIAQHLIASLCNCYIHITYA